METTLDDNLELLEEMNTARNCNYVDICNTLVFHEIRQYKAKNTTLLNKVINAISVTIILRISRGTGNTSLKKFYVLSKVIQF